VRGTGAGNRLWPRPDPLKGLLQQRPALLRRSADDGRLQGRAEYGVGHFVNARYQGGLRFVLTGGWIGLLHGDELFGG
jgi:hypothetical protein